MLLSGKAEYEKRSKNMAMMEATQIEELEKMASPRVMNTHVPAFMLPKQVKDKKVKIIHVYRNLKDTFVSLYFHFKQNPGRETLTLEKLFSQAFFSPKSKFLDLENLERGVTRRRTLLRSIPEKR